MTAVSFVQTRKAYGSQIREALDDLAARGEVENWDFDHAGDLLRYRVVVADGISEGASAARRRPAERRRTMMTTRRERLEAKAEKRRDWAEKQAAKADAAHDRVQEIADGIPFGQPILVGHHSEGRARRDQSRIESGMRKAIDASEKAAGHEAAADGIERQLATSVYDDDADAVERLEEQIVELEAKRDRIKSYNASCRKNPATVAGDLGLLSEEQREDILSLARIGFLSDNGSFPAYALTNLGATIREKKKRVERLRSEQAVRDAGGRGRGREMDARYGGTCADCGVEIGRGERIVWYRLTKEAVHAVCPPGEVFLLPLTEDSSPDPEVAPIRFASAGEA